MEEKFKIITKVLGSERVKLNEPLKYHLKNPTNGFAECFYTATTQKELIEILNLADELKIEVTLLGAGSKVIISGEGIKGLTVKNRTSSVKISGVKGKVSNTGIGVEEAMIEADSGVSIQKLNEFLSHQGLKQIEGALIPQSTIGGSLYIDPRLAELAQKIKVWSPGEVFDIDILELKRKNIIVSVIFKIKSANKK